MFLLFPLPSLFTFFFTVFPTQAVQAAYKAEELVDYSHWQYKSEEGRRIATVEAFNVAKKSLKDLKVQLSQSKNDRKSLVTTLEGAERQAKTQCKQLCQAEFDLVSTKEQNKGLKKKLKEAEKAKDQAEQDGYNVGVAETEEAFRSEVSRVCRVYYSQVWDVALNQAGVEASSALRRPENIYYPPAIRTSGPSLSPDDLPSNVASLIKEAIS